MASDYSSDPIYAPSCIQVLRSKDAEDRNILTEIF